MIEPINNTNFYPSNKIQKRNPAFSPVSSFSSFLNKINKLNKFNKQPPNAQELNCDMFFVDMKTYKKDKEYLKGMSEAVYELSKHVKNKEKFETIMKIALKKVKNIYKNNYLGEQIIPKYDLNSYCLVRDDKGSEYFSRFLKKCAQSDRFKTYSPKANKEYKDANVCQISYLHNTIYVFEGWCDDYKNLTLAKKAYNKLINNKNPKTKDIIEAAATIHWLIAQEAPFQRGNESISNLITKAIFKAYNIQISPLKHGISTDFEAWGCDLDEYIKKYPTFFKKKPSKRMNYLF